MLESKKREREQDTLQMAFLTANVLHYSLLADKPTPPASKQEADKPKEPSSAEMKRDSENMAKFKEEWSRALGGFLHFGAWFNATDITGEPPPESEKPAKDNYDQDHERMLEGNRAMLKKLRAKQTARAAREHR